MGKKQSNPLPQNIIKPPPPPASPRMKINTGKYEEGFREGYKSGYDKGFKDAILAKSRI